MPVAKESTPRQVEFGRRVRARRTKAKWSQERLAIEAGLERTYISQLESGRRNASIENVCKLATALGCDAASLVRGLQDLRGRT